MSCGASHPMRTGQMMVDQRPRFENAVRKRRRKNGNQVIGKAGIIRPDKRQKAKYF